MSFIDTTVPLSSLVDTEQVHDRHRQAVLSRGDASFERRPQRQLHVGGCELERLGRSRELVERAHAIADVCERNRTTLPAAAIAFPLAHPSVVSVCLGARSAEQIERNVGLYAEAIPSDLWAELKSDGLVREDAPVPG